MVESRTRHKMDEFTTLQNFKLCESMWARYMMDHHRVTIPNAESDTRPRKLLYQIMQDVKRSYAEDITVDLRTLNNVALNIARDVFLRKGSDKTGQNQGTMSNIPTEGPNRQQPQQRQQRLEPNALPLPSQSQSIDRDSLLYGGRQAVGGVPRPMPTSQAREIFQQPEIVASDRMLQSGTVQDAGPRKWDDSASPQVTDAPLHNDELVRRMAGRDEDEMLAAILRLTPAPATPPLNSTLIATNQMPSRDQQGSFETKDMFREQVSITGIGMGTAMSTGTGTGTGTDASANDPQVELYLAEQETQEKEREQARIDFGTAVDALTDPEFAMDGSDPFLRMIEEEAGATGDAFLHFMAVMALPSLEEQQTEVIAQRGFRRKENKKKRAAERASASADACVVPGTEDIAPEETLVSRLLLPPVSAQCKAMTDKFVADATVCSAAMDLVADASWNKIPCPTFVSRLLVSTMTIGANLGGNVPRLISEALASHPTKHSSCTPREHLARLLLAPKARAFATQVFGRALAITQPEKNAMRTTYKHARKLNVCASSQGQKRGFSEDEEQGDRETREHEIVDGESFNFVESGEGKPRLFANAVIIMVPDAIEANIKSCKVFTSGALHITGCLTLDEGMKIAGAMGRVVRVALGLPDLGPHPVESLDVQMINTDFAIGMCLDRLALDATVNDAPDPKRCLAKIPESSHASIKLRMTGMECGTILVFTTGKIMMTGFKNWLDLRKAFEYTVEVITENCDAVRSSARKPGGSSSQTNRGRNNKLVGALSPIMQLVPEQSLDVCPQEI